MPSDHAERTRPSGAVPGTVRFRPPTVDDGAALWALAGACGLDQNSPYAYVLWTDHHADTTVVADADGDVAGFVLGFRVPREPSTVFVWQIAVSGDRRGQGLGGRLLDELVERTGAEVIEATVTPSNTASAAMFRALATRHGTTALEAPGYGEHLFPGGHEREVRFRISTRSTTRRNDTRAGVRTARV